MRSLALLLLLTPALPAQAEVYQWTDSNGRLHFGDQPAQGARNVRPVAAPTPARTYPGSSPSPAADPAAAPDARERLERQRRLSEVLAQERAARERERQQAAADAAARARKCQALRRHLQSIEGVRAFHEAPNGERHYLDDAERQAYVERVNRDLEAHCP